jgi:hypothetical protein
MPEPAISAVTSGLNTIIKICEITYALKAVKEQTTALLSTTQHVERNILEAKRLLQQKSELLSFEEKSWMERQVGDTEDALHVSRGSEGQYSVEWVPEHEDEGRLGFQGQSESGGEDDAFEFMCRVAQFGHQRAVFEGRGCCAAGAGDGGEG